MPYSASEKYTGAKIIWEHPMEATIAAERRKLHWRERVALWLGKNVRRWEAIHTQN